MFAPFLQSERPLTRHEMRRWVSRARVFEQAPQGEVVAHPQVYAPPSARVLTPEQRRTSRRRRVIAASVVGTLLTAAIVGVVALVAVASQSSGGGDGLGSVVQLGLDLHGGGGWGP